MKIKLWLFLLLLLPLTMQAQGIFLPQDSTGFGIGFGFSNEDEATGFGLSGYYSIAGFVDFGIGVSRVTVDDGDMSAIGFSPSLTLNVLKSKYVLLAMGASYTRSSYSADYLDQYDLKLVGNSVGLFGEFFLNLQVNQNFRILPMFSYNFVNASLKISDDYGNSDTDSDDNTYFGVGVFFHAKINEKTAIVGAPSILFDEDNKAFNLQIGLQFSAKGQ